MAERYHSGQNGIWEHDVRCGEDRDFTKDEVASIYTEHNLEYGLYNVTVLLKDGTKIVPDYSGYEYLEDAERETQGWRSFILGVDETPSNIKPIETFYKGYHFRSRLEARWAVFFDAINTEWEYEPEGFDLGDGIYYLPDFYLPNAGTRLCRTKGLWIEVKGKMTPEDEEKIIRFSGEKNHDQYGKMDHSIYVVGNIPKGITFADLIADMENICYEGRVPFYNFEYVDGDYYGAFPCANKEGKFELLGDDSNYLADADEKKTVSAFLAARQARFEHGEQGYTNNN